MKAEENMTLTQPDLGLPLEVQEALVKPRGVYTAELFKRLHSDRYELCKRALALGFSKNAIAKALEIAWETVRAVESEAHTGIRELKSRLGDVCFGIAQRRLELLEGDDVAIGKLNMIELGILVDKALLLKGDAGMIMEVRHTVPAMQELAALAQRMGSKAAGMGLGEEGVSAKGPGGPGGAGEVLEAEVVELGAGDSESLDSNS